MVARVVVVEDELSIREILCQFLEMEGFETEAPPHPRDIDRLDPSSPPALFLLDLMLPGISGVELAQELRTRGFVTTPIIGMSASRLMAKVAAASGMFDEVLAKPFDLPDLAECVRTLTAGMAPSSRPTEMQLHP